MGTCCSKPNQGEDLNLTDIGGKNEPADSNQKKKDRYTQDPTIPRNASNAGDAQIAGELLSWRQ